MDAPTPSQTRTHAAIHAALAEDPPADSLLLESHVGPVLVAQGSPHLRSLPRHLPAGAADRRGVAQRGAAN